MRVALVLLDLGAAQNPAVTRRVERFVGGREGREGIGLVVQPKRRDSHAGHRTSRCGLGSERTPVALNYESVNPVAVRPLQPLSMVGRDTRAGAVQRGLRPT